MNPVIGRIDVVIGGAHRELACDMRAVAILHDELGDGWAEWLTERFAGVLMPQGDGSVARVSAAIPREDLALTVYALLATDRSRARCVDSRETLLAAASLDELAKLQEHAMDSIGPSFGVPGKGLERTRKARKSKGWDWRLILETALGLMEMEPDTFWSLTLAEWRAKHDGFAAKEKRAMRRQAWALSYTLIAAGCDAEKVSPAKLLGEKERRPRRSESGKRAKLPIDKLYEKLKQNGAFGA